MIDGGRKSKGLGLGKLVNVRSNRSLKLLGVTERRNGMRPDLEI